MDWLQVKKTLQRYTQIQKYKIRVEESEENLWTPE